MKLLDCMITTAVADDSMTVGEALRECVNCRVPGIPFVDKDGKIIGRFSIRNMFYITSIPADLIKNAHLLGNNIEHLDVPEANYKSFMEKPARDFIVEWIIHLSPDSPVVKALALMEQFDTPYLFVVDENDCYLGVVTSIAIAARLVEEE